MENNRGISKSFDIVTSSFNFLVENQNLVSVRCKHWYKDVVKEVTFGLSRDSEFLVLGSPLSTISINEKCYSIRKEKGVLEFSSDIEGVIKSLSKNKQKEYSKVIGRLEEKLTYKRIEDYFSFLNEHIGFSFRTDDSFPISILRVSEFDKIGLEKLEIRKEIAKNNKSKEYFLSKIQRLENENKQLRERLTAI